MCICATDSSRPRFFNTVSVLLITGWVLVVSLVAHSVPADRAAVVSAVENLVEDK